MASSTLILFGLIFGSASAFGHAGFAIDGVLKPRSNSTSLKSAPCGDVARTATPTELTVGEVITVNWRETINHPGHFELQFSKDGDVTWQTLKSIPDNQDGGNLPHLFSTQLTLPSEPCTGCTMRLIQSMEENPASPSLYYSCADITLKAKVTPPVTPPVVVPPVTPPAACP